MNSAEEIEPPSERRIVDAETWRQPPSKEPPPSMISRQMAGLRTDEEIKSFVSSGQDEKQVAVVQYGASWCRHCHEVFPTYYAYSKKFKRIRFAVAHVDSLVDEGKHLRKTPTFTFYKNGKRIDEVYGADMDVLKDRLWLHQGRI